MAELSFYDKELATKLKILTISPYIENISEALAYKVPLTSPS